VRLAKAAHAQQMRVSAVSARVAEVTATAAQPSHAGASSGTTDTDDPMACAAPHPPVAEHSSFYLPGSSESASQGSATPLQSNATPVGSDAEEDAGQGPNVSLDTWDELIDTFFPSTTASGSQSMAGLAPGTAYRSLSRRAGVNIEEANDFSDRIGALNEALAAKLNVTRTP